MGGVRTRVDTRNKILTPEAAIELAGSPIALVVGTFDVLRAEHVRELTEACLRSSGATVLVIVLPLEGEALPQRARAELVAALRAADHVIAGDRGDLQDLISTLDPICVMDLEEDDERRRRELRERIVSRLPA
jgi:glycerol-3-phosphate cytidylyltransferase-like family protein